MKGLTLPELKPHSGNNVVIVEEQSLCPWSRRECAAQFWRKRMAYLENYVGSVAHYIKKNKVCHRDSSLNVNCKTLRQIKESARHKRKKYVFYSWSKRIFVKRPHKHIH